MSAHKAGGEQELPERAQKVANGAPARFPNTTYNVTILRATQHTPAPGPGRSEPVWATAKGPLLASPWPSVATHAGAGLALCGRTDGATWTWRC